MTKDVPLSDLEKANVDLLRSFEEKQRSSSTHASISRQEVEVVGLDPKSDGFLAVRDAPSATAREIGRLLQGDRATVVASSGAWRRLSYGGSEGWAHSKWLSPVVGSASVTIHSTTSTMSPIQVEVVGLDLNGDGFLAVRTGPSASFPQVGRLLQGDRVTAQAASGAWRRLSYWGGEGWAHSKWLAPVEDPGSTTSLSMTVVSEDRAPNNEEVASLQRDVAAMNAQIAELTGIFDANASNAVTASAPHVDGDQASARVAQLEQRREKANRVLDRYATPVRPQDASSDANARQMSEAFQKVPFFIPGTSTFGEVWVEPIVTDEGELRFSWNFVDPGAEYQKVALAISMTPDEVERLSGAFNQVVGWSKTAHDNKIRRAFEKEAACFPSARCGNVEGPSTNTTVLFRVGDDGSTSMVVKRTQGPLARFYAFSIESTKVLAVYFDRVLEESRREYRGATATDDDLKALFE